MLSRSGSSLVGVITLTSIESPCEGGAAVMEPSLERGPSLLGLIPALEGLVVWTLLQNYLVDAAD
jgi:hypothetical protein